jgi:hypothetical protein
MKRPRSHSRIFRGPRLALLAPEIVLVTLQVPIGSPLLLQLGRPLLPLLLASLLLVVGVLMRIKLVRIQS